ncbi:TPA: hypothetical protein NOS95_002698 [Pseudomonas aeruginosa]|uniref:hypothetical protein n=1 Tax=Pseudomonas TaxID=286 RepID=UPI00053ED94F|nr:MULTISPECIES: hypothetical protein [Pseudomonas]KAA5667256.1 hypothetical protein F3G62_26875 [Pseudomonas aeruginosa]MBY9835066.1 hypothetical protein [Pseudomonas aeruginosa]MCS8141498.1 hypothetical protein [Pseudomonas aeruginosa]MDI3949452.1 hypothetical protein [Pseudomonas aeruginosa]MDU0699501.1 hypothetical protein [Pseudomonas aeruginosa]
MNFFKSFVPLSAAEREELRQLRTKCEYQQRWINNHIDTRSPQKIESARVEQLKRALQVQQRRISRLMDEQPDIWKRYFAKGADA